MITIHPERSGNVTTKAEVNPSNPSNSCRDISLKTTREEKPGEYRSHNNSLPLNMNACRNGCANPFSKCHRININLILLVLLDIKSGNQ